MKIQVIIAAGGLGKRFKSRIPKPLVLLNGKPILAYSLDIFEANQGVDGIVIAGVKKYLTRFQALANRYEKVRAVVSGGVTRADSVRCGLAVLDKDTDIILVHDAARPLVDQGTIRRVLAALKSNRASLAAVPVKATVKKVNQRTLIVEETPRRDLLWEAQTPQGFHKDVLARAHQRRSAKEATDDAMLVEAMGVKVKVVMGDYRNIKITTPEDLGLAMGLLARARDKI